MVLHSRALRGAALLLLLPLCAALGAEGDSVIALRVGGQARREVPGLKRVAVSHPAIADVRTEGASTVVVKGVAPGSTRVVAWTAQGQTSWDVVVR